MARDTEELRNHELVIEMFKNVLMPLDPTHVDKYMRPDYIQHSALVSDGIAGLKQFLAEKAAAFPNAEIVLKRSFVEGNFVICHYHVRETPETAGLAVIDLFRIEDHQIAEHWEAVQPVIENLPHSNGLF